MAGARERYEMRVVGLKFPRGDVGVFSSHEAVRDKHRRTALPIRTEQFPCLPAPLEFGTVLSTVRIHKYAILPLDPTSQRRHTVGK